MKLVKSMKYSVLKNLKAASYVLDADLQLFTLWEVLVSVWLRCSWPSSSSPAALLHFSLKSLVSKGLFPPLQKCYKSICELN